jgi:cobalamin biosynthesis protein CobD/CbiB
METTTTNKIIELEKEKKPLSGFFYLVSLPIIVMSLTSLLIVIIICLIPIGFFVLIYYLVSLFKTKKVTKKPTIKKDCLLTDDIEKIKKEYAKKYF